MKPATKRFFGCSYSVSVATDGAAPPTFDEVRARLAPRLAPSRRRPIVAVAFASLLVAAAVAVAIWPDEPGRSVVASEPAASGWTWSVGEPNADVARYEDASVWTGELLLTWGGFSAAGAASADGAAYDVAERTWVDLPTAPLAARGVAASTWTGRELFVWGGAGTDGAFADGAAYDPATRTWRTVADAPISARAGAAAAFVEGAVVVAGGATDDASPSADVASYDPGTDVWTVVPPLPVPLEDVHVAAFDGGPVVWSDATCEVFIAGAVGEPWQDVSVRGSHCTVGSSGSTLLVRSFGPTDEAAADWWERSSGTAVWEPLAAPSVQPDVGAVVAATETSFVVAGRGCGLDGVDGADLARTSSGWETLPAVDEDARPLCGAKGFTSGHGIVFWGGGSANGSTFDGAVRVLSGP